MSCIFVWTVKGYYAILQVSENASFQEIKRAYRRLAREYHPDRNNSSFAEDMIKKIKLLLKFFRIRTRELNTIGPELTMSDLSKLMHTMLQRTTLLLNETKLVPSIIIIKEGTLVKAILTTNIVIIIL
jgi:hypothetical protein